MQEDFYLDIAHRELEQLKACPGPIVLGSTEHSAHFRHAVVTSVFSAFAVEYALTTFIWGKCVLAVPESDRQSGLKKASAVHRMTDKLAFIRRETKIPKKLIDQIGDLFKYRNRISHAQLELFDGKVLDIDAVQELNDSGRGSELDEAISRALRGKRGDDDTLRALADELGIKATYLTFKSGIGTPDLEVAEKNLETAVKAVEAIHQEALT